MIEVFAAGEYRKRTISEMIRNVIGGIILAIAFVVSIVVIIGSIVAMKHGFHVAGVALIPASALAMWVVEIIIGL